MTEYFIAAKDKAAKSAALANREPPIIEPFSGMVNRCSGYWQPNPGTQATPGFDENVGKQVANVGEQEQSRTKDYDSRLTSRLTDTPQLNSCCLHRWAWRLILHVNMAMRIKGFAYLLNNPPGLFFVTFVAQCNLIKLPIVLCPSLG